MSDNLNFGYKYYLMDKLKKGTCEIEMNEINKKCVKCAH